MTDFYSTLGVDRSADPETIKRAYRKLAAQHHPDRGGDTNRFQEIQAAYDTLSDPEKRSQYDNPQPQGFQFNFGQGFPGGFGSIFEQHFGPGHPFGDFFTNRQGPRNRNANLQTTITLEDAYFGKEVVAEIGFPSGKKHTVNIKIPAGVHDGTTIRLAGLGDDSIPNAPRGDILLTVLVQPDPRFERNGDDLVKEIEINCFEAMLGKKMFIDTLHGSRLEISINPGTQPGQILSIPGYGMPNMNHNHMKGKLLLQVKVSIPTFLNESTKQLLQQIKL